ncbi:PIF1-like helicase domain-containing protein [Hirsutella rhossiliensis]|uniref:ATP-dependent DNA helicase n=1 Tax=Hirsutella rhossiliensis TaxID=111463 RepID=A0A9P8MN74_9HYPO|nr:PIF1-like helicase domain-containing protein [Hirsutella rhossiliensis]KAH0957071.1 PIF1-like helicase domain-containing protein [Hirsutella rhossiliensis]
MHLHGRLGCEHAYPDELKDLTPLEEKLISLNSCYGFVTKYSIPGGQRQSVLPHPLVRVMDEIHVSWQGAERPGPRDLSGLLSVRRSAVERALAWLKENNPLYGEVEIDAAEIASWGAAARTPPRSRDVGLTCEDDDRDGARPEEDGDVINEVTSSGMFPLDGAPDVADAEKIRFARDAVGPEGARASPRTWVGTAARGAAGDGGDGEPYIQVRRGEDFADSADASFFAKAFPTLFPLGAQAERVAEGLMSTRNMKLQAWADVVLRRHGGRFATHPIFAFLVFNMGVRSKNRQASMLGAELEATANVEESRLIKLRLAAHRGRDPDEAEAFLSDLGTAYKRTRLAISDPMSSAVFFHREMTLFFEHYVNVGEESVFGHVGAYYGAIASSEELDAEGYCAMQAERSATADISSRLDDVARFTDTFDEEANFCAGATQIHTHSATCAPWRLVERTALTADGVLEIRRTHSMVNRWNRAMAVGLRHNHDISFIATQRKTMALIYYITNYATKVEDPVWKRVAAAAEFLPVLEPTGEATEVAPTATPGNKTRTFLLKAANRVFTERPLSQVEVIAHLLGYPAEFSSGSAWAYINANQLYWAVFRRWRHLRRASGAEATGDAPDETALRRPGCGATVCVDGYLSKEFSEEDDESCHRRAAVQHLALFVPWDNVQLLRRSAEDAKRDAKQWAATAEEGELLAMTQQLCRFQQSALGSAAELAATVVADERAVAAEERGAGRERAIQGIQGGGAAAGVGADRGAALRGVMGGFGEDDIDVTAADGDADAGTAAGMRELAGQLTLNEKQAIALLIVCRQLDRIRQGDDAGGDGGGQLCLFIGGEGGTGKSRVIEALVELLARRTYRAGGDEDIDGVRLAGQGERFVDGRSRMDWQEKEVLVIDEVSMLGARTLHAANEQLCRLRGSARDFGGIPVVILCGDFHQFRPVQERSILLPSAAVAWDEDGAFAAEQRRQHDKAHALWRRFTTVVMLDEQMRAAGDPELRRLLGRIRRGEQDRSDLELLNSRCYRPGRRIPWETGLTVVTPLNRNRWNLNLEAALAFRERRRTAARVFLSSISQGDDSATPVPAVFLFVPGMPVVVNQNTHQGLKLVNGAGVKITAQRKRPWQRNDVSRRGLPCAAAFACTDYKVQGGTPERVALELRGARMTTVEGRAVPSSCDPYSLYVQLSRCPTLDGIMLVSEVRSGT